MNDHCDLFTWGHFVAGEILCAVSFGCVCAGELVAGGVLAVGALGVLASWLRGEEAAR